MKKRFNITGMGCAACSSRIEREISNMRGVDRASVNLLTNSMEVNFDEKALSGEDIAKEVEKLGYGAKEISSEDDGQNDEEDEKEKHNFSYEEKRLRNRFLISLVFAVPVFFISMIDGVQKMFPSEAGWILVCGIMTVPIIAANYKIYKSGLTMLFKRTPNMDSLIAVGTIASVILSYFDSIGMILTLVDLGKWLEARAKKRTTDALTGLMNLTPDMASVIRDEEELIVPVASIKKNETVLCRPGETIAVDGVILQGQTSINQAAITGESIPVDAAEGDNVVGGTINLNGYITYRATAVGKDTVLSEIISLVEEASSGKAPISRLADKVSGVFVPAVMVMAAITVLIWAITTWQAEGTVNWNRALICGISVLVISCPCALGLATPVAIMVSTGRGAKEGIIIKSAEALERLGKTDTLIFDKTGTITEGKPEVADVILLQGKSREQILSLAASLEEGSEHPLGKAICLQARKEKLNVKKTKDFKYTFGQGIEGNIDGVKYFLGNQDYILDKYTDKEKDAKYRETINPLTKQGKTAVLLADSTDLIGIIALADRVKATSVEALTMMAGMNKEMVLLTGDNQNTAEAIAKQVGITRVYAEILPGDKDSIVQEIQKEGKLVAMVGDGVNDAPAITRADVGIAIGTGTDIAIDAADIVIMGDNLIKVETAIKLSQITIKNIKGSLFWAFFYNIICIPVAAGILYLPFGILLNPMIAAAAMSLSSISVVLNSLRLKKKELLP